MPLDQSTQTIPARELKRVSVLGFPVDVMTKTELFDRFEKFLRSQNFHQIVTLNPEFIMAARVDRKFGSILARADLVVCDGAGVQWAAKYLSEDRIRNVFLSLFSFVLHPPSRRQVLPERLTGADILPILLDLANQRRLSVAIFHRLDSLSTPEKISETVKRNWPDVKLRILTVGKVNFQIAPETFESIPSFSPAMTFCDLGAPEQDFLLSQIGSRVSSVRIAMGVGGSFDYLTGSVHRAPAFLRTVALEWLWRLVLEPTRINRIFTATFRFIWAVQREKRQSVYG